MTAIAVACPPLQGIEVGDAIDATRLSAQFVFGARSLWARDKPIECTVIVTPTTPRARYIAPFNLQDVVQVVVTPCWHFRQAATH
jgi:hypothetical protein